MKSKTLKGSKMRLTHRDPPPSNPPALLPISHAGPPHVRPLGSVTAVAGETFKVRCPVAGYPIQSITWSKGNTNYAIRTSFEVKYCYVGLHYCLLLLEPNPIKPIV